MVKRAVREEDELMTPEAVAARFGVLVSTLANWRSRGRYGPAYIRIGGPIRGAIRYRRSDVERYLESGRQDQEVA